jgi:hypothetical protein
METQGIIGDAYPTELPVTEVPEQDLTEEKKMAKFSKTAEFKRLKTHMEERIAYYQTFLPSGKSVLEAEDVTKLGQNWLVAQAIVTELQAIIDAYELANETVKNAQR